MHKVLEHGFLEKVYQRAMVVELEQRCLKAETEFPIHVMFKGVVVGDHVADLFVERKVMVELKVTKEYNPKDEPQLLNELKATGVDIGLLINFGQRKVEFKRFVFTDLSACRPRLDSQPQDPDGPREGNSWPPLPLLSIGVDPR